MYNLGLVVSTVFLVLKLLGMFPHSWWVVIIPAVAPACVACVIIIIALILRRLLN